MINTTQRKILVAIFVTMIALISHRYLPQKTQVIWPSAQTSTYFHSGTLANGLSAASWLNESEHSWRCIFPEKQINYFPCALNIQLSAHQTSAMDFSGYSHLRVQLDFAGSAEVVQISFRNFNGLYTKVTDPNSNKVMAVNLLTKELNQEILIDLNKFTVAHWWIVQYRIPLALVQTEMNHVIGMNIDFPSLETPIVGEQQLTLKKVELVGEWIDAKNWYLGILCIWIFGILGWIGLGFINLRHKNLKDTVVISELADSNKRLKFETDKFRRLSTIDPLTQTYNRFGIDQIIANIIESSAHENNVNMNHLPLFSLILIDVDHFKRINDTRGHETGDKVLQRMAQIIHNYVRQDDFVGRWGGEEFLVIQPFSTARESMAQAEILRDAVASSPFEPSNPLTVTASFGVSEFMPGDDFATCFKRADSALYSAKAAGRNCCILAT